MANMLSSDHAGACPTPAASNQLKMAKAVAGVA